MFEGLFQPMHLLVIFAIALLVFGPKRLPELGKGIGQGIKSLKEGLRDGEQVITSANFLIDAESKVQGALKDFETANRRNGGTEGKHEH